MGKAIDKIGIQYKSSGFAFAYSVLAILLLLTIGATLLFYQSEQSKDSVRFENEVNRFQAGIQNRLNIYGALLNAGRGFVQSTDGVDGRKFRTYIESLDLQANFSGIRRIGFVKTIRASDVPAITAKIRADGNQDFSLFPAVAKDTYQVLIYAEPMDDATRRSIGFDLSSDQTRNALLESARDSGIAAASGQLMPLLDKENSEKPVIAIFLPLYKSLDVPDDVPGRRQQLQGFIYSSFKAESFLSEVIPNASNPDVQIQIFDGSESAENLLAESSPGAASSFSAIDGNSLNDTRGLELSGRKWIVKYSTRPAFFIQSSLGWAPWIFVTGVLFSFLLFAVTYRDSAARIQLQNSADKLLDVQRQLEYLFEKEKKSRVAAEQASIAKDEFIAVISHELKTPLNAIAGWTRILRANEISGETRETAVMKIEKNLRQQTSLIEQIIAYSDLVSQRTDISGRTANISSVFDKSIEETLPVAVEKNIELRVENNLNGHIIDGDEEKLKIVLINLLSNSLKFTEPGGQVHAVAIEDADSIKIVVSDNGAGIGSDVLPQIFDHYRQADRPNTRGYGGLGLGLAISRHIVQMHKGTISAASEGKGKGSVFTVSFPYKKKSD